MLDEIVSQKDKAIDAINSAAVKQKEEILEDLDKLREKLIDIDIRSRNAIDEIMNVYYDKVTKETNKYIKESTITYSENAEKSD